MAISTTRFTLVFATQGLSGLTQAQNSIRGIERTAVNSLPRASSSYSNFAKTIERSNVGIITSIYRLDRSMRFLAGLTGTALITSGLVKGAEAVGKAFLHTNAQIQSSKILLEELLGGKGTAGSFLTTIQEKASTFGYDFGEVMKSSRGLMQVMKQVNPNLNAKSLDKMLNMVMATSSMDLESRGLSYTAFSFKEAFQGMGQGDFRSLKNRLEINLGKSIEQSITKAIKKGDLDKAIDLFDKGLKRIGIDSERLLNRMSGEGYTQNINRLQGYLTMTFQKMGNQLFDLLIKPIVKLNTFLSYQFKEGSTGLKILNEVGENIASSWKPALEYVDKFGKSLYKNRFEIVALFREMSSSGFGAISGFGSMLNSFFKGLSGMQFGGANDRVKNLMDMMKALEKFGKNAGMFFNSMIEPVNNLGRAINNLAGSIIKLFGGSNKGGVLAGLTNVFAGGVEGLASGVDSVAGLMGRNGRNENNSSSTGFMDYANMGLNALMIYGMFKGFRSKPLSNLGATGTGAISQEARAIQSEANLSRNQVTRSRKFSGAKKKTFEVSGIDLYNTRIRVPQDRINKFENKISALNKREDDLKREINILESARGNLDKNYQNNLKKAYDKKYNLLNKQEKDIEKEISLNNELLKAKNKKLLNKQDEIQWYKETIAERRNWMHQEKKRFDNPKNKEELRSLESELNEKYQQKTMIEMKNNVEARNAKLEQQLNSIKEKKLHYEKMYLQKSQKTFKDTELIELKNKENELRNIQEKKQFFNNRIKKDQKLVDNAQENLDKRSDLFQKITTSDVMAGVGTGANVLMAGAMAKQAGLFGSMGGLTGGLTTIMGFLTGGTFIGTIVAGVIAGGAIRTAYEFFWSMSEKNTQRKSEEQQMVDQYDLESRRSAKYNKRLPVISKLLQSQGISREKASEFFSTLTSPEMAYMRYSHSAPDQQKLMRTMYENLQSGAISREEVNNLFGAKGLAGLEQMQHVINLPKGSIFLEKLSPEVMRDFEKIIAKQLGLIKIPVEGAGQGKLSFEERIEQTKNVLKGGGIEQ